jgi:hypothetical protein
MTTGAFTLLKHAAQNRERWLGRFYAIGKEAVRPRRPGELFGFVILPAGKNAQRLVDILQYAKVEVGSPRGRKAFTVNGVSYPANSWVVRMDQPHAGFAKALLESQRYPDLRDADGHPIPPYDVTAHTLPLLMNVEVRSVVAPFHHPISKSEPAPVNALGDTLARISKVAIYRSHVPSMDEGWTRWVINQEVKTRNVEPALSLTDKQIRAGRLLTRSQFIIIPDQSPQAILNGHRLGIMPTEYTGGLGEEGVKALREFVEQGGTLVCLNRASNFAIEQFRLPVRNTVAGVLEKEFFVPGSILRIELDTSHPITRGMPKQSIAWVEDSPVFELIEEIGTLGQQNVRVIARYPQARSPLLSGWLLGAERMKGKAALVEVELGKGRIILFGFRPQYRAQSLATYPLLFNAISSE